MHVREVSLQIPLSIVHTLLSEYQGERPTRGDSSDIDQDESVVRAMETTSEEVPEDSAPPCKVTGETVSRGM